MKTARRLLSILFGLGLPLWLHAGPIAYITHQNGVSIVDLGFRAVIAELPANKAQGVEVRPDLNRAYAADNDRVTVIDARAQAPIATAALATAGISMVVRPGRPEIYVVTAAPSCQNPVCPAFFGNIVRIFNTDTNSVGDAFQDGSPVRVAFSPDGNVMYLAGSSTSAVRVVNASTRQDIAPAVAVTGNPQGMAVSGDGRWLYVAENGFGNGNSVAVIDTTTRTLATRITVGRGPQEIVLSGGRLYVTNTTSNTVSVIDESSRQMVATVGVGSRPMGIDATPNGDQVVVANNGSNSITVIDTSSLNVVTTIPVGPAPLAIGRFIIGSSAPQMPDVLTGLWWNPAEPGWGVHVAHRGNRIFAAWFTYDGSGKPKWYVSSDCTLNSSLPTPPATGEATCTGNIYETTGPRFFSDPYNVGAVTVNKLGLFQMGFRDKDNGAMSFVIGSNVKTMTLKRQVFAAGNIPGVDYTDLWWNPAESGWGIGITQQATIMFLAWFAYDDTGTARWYIASNCAMNATGNGCTGDVYRTSGPVDPLRNPFDPSKLQVTKVGTIAASFADANTGRLDYVVDGKAGSKQITRQLF